MWFVILGVAALLGITVFSMRSRIITILSEFIPAEEGFRATPYWDVSRWSWGYGTEAPGPNGTITRARAMADAVSYLLRDYEDLKPRVSRNLNAHQWAALLSFSYNLGVGNAYKILADINAGNDVQLEGRWKSFVKSDGVTNPVLVARRAREWQLWNS